MLSFFNILGHEFQNFYILEHSFQNFQHSRGYLKIAECEPIKLEISMLFRQKGRRQQRINEMKRSFQN